MYKETDGGFKSLGEFLLAVKRSSLGGVNYGNRLKTMTEGTDSAGGFLVPTQFEGMLLAAAVERAVVRPRARVIPVNRDAVFIPTMVETDRTTYLYGGITGAWVAEGTEMSSSTKEPVYGQLRVPIHEGVTLALVTQNLEDDATDFGGFFAQAFGEAAAWYEDEFFIHGTGVNQPLGVMNSPALISVTRANNLNVVAADIPAMMARLLPGSHDRAIWLMNQSVLANFMADPSTTGYGLTDFIDYAGQTLAGLPYVVTEKCAAMGTVGDLILADFSHYVIADRGMTISVSAHPGFTANKTYWRVVLRVGGQPLLSSAITPKRGGSTVSPFVALAATS